ncbi:hypothetical protein EG346_20035 [Chryseobacterium carnipullorum]|uniref:Bacteriocin-type signal sequence-containing protein n=1 Tax=Chryseobacterium carnipullorum TaxID=1124835 RepID=A0A376E159_CHRCU|nr:hypothetical protein [Chryseobacterium carnipullorum]AZA50326.1 hypothetical protein EG346_20035 [Chryseobacterium carnipullorum]AZA65199.1 hypothetical protein EG345_11090 [Chryseobacterium carnipullorum]STC98483.1 Uncharacterised protein [Chryseobacterium carnipullorum]
MKNFESLKRMATKFSREKMKTINGGMQWTDQRSCNIEDERPGADPMWWRFFCNLTRYPSIKIYERNPHLISGDSFI